MWNMKHVPHCPQNIWTVAVDQLWLCGWNQAFSPKRLQIYKYRNIISVSTRIAATYFFPFHLKSKAPWGQSCDLLLVFGKSHCNQQFLQGNNHMAPFVLPFSKSFRQLLQMQHIHHSHIISMIVGEKVKNLSTVKLVASMACQVYQITMGTQAMLDSGMVAAADISQVCQISAAKGTNFLAKDFACNKPGSIANTSGSESLSISRVKTS